MFEERKYLNCRSRNNPNPQIRQQTRPIIIVSFRHLKCKPKESKEQDKPRPLKARPLPTMQMASRLPLKSRIKRRDLPSSKTETERVLGDPEAPRSSLKKARTVLRR